MTSEEKEFAHLMKSIETLKADLDNVSTRLLRLEVQTYTDKVESLSARLQTIEDATPDNMDDLVTKEKRPTAE